LSDPTAIRNQTIWQINDSSNGVISGETISKSSIAPAPIETSFTGVVTPAGQVRMEFGSAPTTGIGQMRFVDGEWRIAMQMVAESSTAIVQWAYMSQLPSTAQEPGVPDTPPSDDFLSDKWSWIEGTRWALSDAALFGGDGIGVFEIKGYQNGYYWGSGTSSKPFNVLGSLMLEGALLLFLTGVGAPVGVRMGVLRETPSGWVMQLRAYEGTPDTGFAWELPEAVDA
jgi:hypothetical protein